MERAIASGRRLPEIRRGSRCAAGHDHRRDGRSEPGIPEAKCDAPPDRDEVRTSTAPATALSVSTTGPRHATGVLLIQNRSSGRQRCREPPHLNSGRWGSCSRSPGQRRPPRAGGSIRLSGDARHGHAGTDGESSLWLPRCLSRSASHSSRISATPAYRSRMATSSQQPRRPEVPSRRKLRAGLQWRRWSSRWLVRTTTAVPKRARLERPDVSVEDRRRATFGRGARLHIVPTAV